MAIKNEDLRQENIFLQDKLTSMGLRMEDLKNQNANAGEKIIQKKLSEKEIVTELEKLNYFKIQNSKIV